MARIKIDDLPVLEDLSEKQMKGIFGGLSSISGSDYVPVKPAGLPSALGSHYTSAPHDLGTETPGGVSYDAGAAINSRLINQALLSAYTAGLTHHELDTDLREESK